MHLLTHHRSDALRPAPLLRTTEPERGDSDQPGSLKPLLIPALDDMSETHSHTGGGI